MEPFDIDKIVRNKLQESNDLHEHEIDSAKPFVWTAIQNQIGAKSSSLSWYHLAAAIVLMVISFSLVLYNIQKGHDEELSLLSNKIDELQNNYSSQEKLINIKDDQVESLNTELQNVELQLADLQLNPLSTKSRIEYRTDTVFIQQIEYIAPLTYPVEPKDDPLVINVEQPEQLTAALVPDKETDDIIFPSNTNKSGTQPTETIKVKFGPVVARKN